MRLKGSRTASLAAAMIGICLVLLLVAGLSGVGGVGGADEAEWEILVQRQIHRGYPYIYRIYGPPNQEAYLWTTVGHLSDAPARIVTDARGEAALTVKLEWRGGDQHGDVYLTRTEQKTGGPIPQIRVIFSTAPPPPTPTAVPPPTRTPTPTPIPTPTPVPTPTVTPVYKYITVTVTATPQPTPLPPSQWCGDPAIAVHSLGAVRPEWAGLLLSFLLAVAPEWAAEQVLGSEPC